MNIILAGGGEMQQTTQTTLVPEPPQDNTALYVTSGVVPLLVAGITAWAIMRKKS